MRERSVLSLPQVGFSGQAWVVGSPFSCARCQTAPDALPALGGVQSPAPSAYYLEIEGSCLPKVGCMDKRSFLERFISEYSAC